MRIPILLLFFLFSMMTACGNDTQEKYSDADAGTTTTRAAEGDSQTERDIKLAELGYRPDEKLKTSLKAELLDIAQQRKRNESDDPIPTMINELSSLFRTLSVTARALDRSEAFRKDITEGIRRFRETDRSRKGEAGKIMNGMTGTYEMYALLAKMKFLGREDKQKEIQEINDRTIKSFRPEVPAIEAAAAIAEACYDLTHMIMTEIDSEGRFTEAFKQIERQYQQGVQVAKKEEDHFINGIYRTFEISQMWAIALNPTREDDVAKMSAGISDETAEAENVGTQMGIAVRYLYFISYIIAEDTVALTL
jgi:hypothetical protein